MRSMKLLVATAIVAALVAGPVLAQDAGGTMSPAPAADSGKTTTAKKHHGKKHKKKSSSSTSTPSTTTPAQ
jgi:hypothetical protein